ncbi:MAG: hypothetical protein ACK559_23540, partial [bacterium]
MGIGIVEPAAHGDRRGLRVDLVVEEVDPAAMRVGAVHVVHQPQVDDRLVRTDTESAAGFPGVAHDPD